MNAKEKRKRVELSIEQKQEIINYAENHPSIKQVQLRVHFNSHFNTIIGKSTLSEILSSKKKFSNEENITAKRLRTAKHPELEECVFLWHC